jgi:membrane protease YdiL (CAAX protease family)
MTLIGLAYGVVAQRTGSIVGVTASHALLVLGALLVWPALSGV